MAPPFCFLATSLSDTVLKFKAAFLPELAHSAQCAAKLHQEPKKLRFCSLPAKVVNEMTANRNIQHLNRDLALWHLSRLFIFSVRQSFFGLKNPLAKAQDGFFRGAFKRTFEER
jgi:hypothetical protein